MKEVKLNNGIIMPAVGYGTYQTAPEETTKNVLLALQTGYRLIDTAQYYGNEAEVGEALTESGLARDQVFVTTKVQTSGYAATKAGLDESLRRFNHDYFDLVIIHWPTGNDDETYRALEDAYQDGKVRQSASVTSTLPRSKQLSMEQPWPRRLTRLKPTCSGSKSGCTPI